jgi:hypothetical protein
MEIVTYKNEINAREFLNSRFSGKDRNSIYLMVSDLGMNDDAVIALLNNLNNFYRLMQEIHNIDKLLYHPTKEYDHKAVKADRYSKVVESENILAKINSSIKKKLVIRPDEA